MYELCFSNLKLKYSIHRLTVFYFTFDLSQDTLSVSFFTTTLFLVGKMGNSSHKKAAFSPDSNIDGQVGTLLTYALSFNSYLLIYNDIFNF